MRKSASILFLGCAAALAAGSAWAGHGHWRFGVYVGPYWGPWYYPPPVYAYPPTYAPVIIERQAPPVYVEQPAAPAPAPPPPSFWYYCEAAKGYYPYVRECPGGWQRVSPQPPGQ